jgi:polyhydroxyalkanoate synthesis repressor PhaR
MAEEKKKQPIIIRKYANRRLYNTEISSYVTLEDLCTMIKKGENFIVRDAKTGQDITKSVLQQIIFEQESKGANLLPAEFLKNVIAFYDDSLKNVVPVYLNSVMQAFIHKQDEIKKGMGSNTNPFKPFEDIYRSMWGNQQEIFNKTLDMFSSFNPLINNPSKPGKKQ